MWEIRHELTETYSFADLDEVQTKKKEKFSVTFANLIDYVYIRFVQNGFLKCMRKRFQKQEN